MTNRHEIAKHAAACLNAAIRNDAAAAQAAASDMINTLGPDVLPQAMLAWIDAALAAQGIAPNQAGPAHIVFGDLSTGRVATDAGDVEPAVAWAGRLMNARIAGDQDTWTALMGAVPDGQDNRYINVLLGCCAQTVRLGPHLRPGAKP